jgi:MFS family permease
MRTFFIVWIGQLASMLGSEMTNFAITIWAWSVTQQATPLSLILFFTQTPKVIAALFAGVLVDRWDRQKLMIVGDILAGCSTIAILFLFLSDRLEIWHLYLTSAVNGLFGFLQSLAYSASLSAIIPQQHYTRATALNSVQMSSAYIFAPALAGTLYPIIGLTGILSIDIVTFFIANSSNQAIWISKVQPDIQGRVFAARDLIAQIAIPLGAASAGILGDRFFEPAMRNGGSLAKIFGCIFGNEIGAGMALMITLFSSCGFLLALGSYAFPLLREVEEIIPDYKSET